MDENIQIVQYNSSYINDIYLLFVNSIKKTCNKDYTKDQINAWISGVNISSLNHMLNNHYTLIAIYQNQIVGFGDITDLGYLNMLYVDSSFQRKNIAILICDELEKHVKLNITVDASITAMNFFLKRGYKVVTKQTVYRNNVPLNNYKMIKINN